ncbi:MAG: nuclear transport factor 2 family protein [Myxococcales bacterium]|nr:nuclear transport factor 2 family protein [Myxococcales bacterium]
MTHRQLWERYVASWKTDDAEERTRLFGAALSPDCVYTDPNVRLQGYDALRAYMEQFHQQVPGGHFVTKTFMAHHDQSVATWNMCDGEGNVLGDGISFGKFAEGGTRLLSMTGFFETP